VILFGSNGSRAPTTGPAGPPAFKIMPKYGCLQIVQAKLDPTGTYLVYRSVVAGKIVMSGAE
jgi:hypothetical protein